MNKKFVTVFGSSIPRLGDTEYEIAYRLGKNLAMNGFNVCTGGFLGIMEAVSKGAVEFNSEAIGVTLDIYNVKPNQYITKEIKCSSLFERIRNLIEIGSAFVILKGGTGTLLELAVVWEYMNKNMMVEKPIACHSSLWKDIVIKMEEQIAKENRKTGLVQPFDNIDECAGYIISKLNNIERS